MPNTAISTSYDRDHYHAAFQEDNWHQGLALADVLAASEYDVKISLHESTAELVIEWPILKRTVHLRGGAD